MGTSTKHSFCTQSREDSAVKPCIVGGSFRCQPREAVRRPIALPSAGASNASKTCLGSQRAAHFIKSWSIRAGCHTQRNVCVSSVGMFRKDVLQPNNAQFVPFAVQALRT